MTREEAITVLKAFMENPLFSEVHKAAFNIAIHDIKAYQDWNINNLILVNKDNYEPTTKNNLGVDAISREQAIEEADKLCLETGYDNEKVIEMLNDLPAVTPQEPRKGHWKEHPHEAGPNWEYSMYECSECHGWLEDDSDYCPDCGAKMVEPQESEGKEND